MSNPHPDPVDRPSSWQQHGSQPPPPDPYAAAPPPPPGPQPWDPPLPGGPGAGVGPVPGGGPTQPGQLPLTPPEARQWAMLAHIGAILLGFVAPLIVMLVYGPRDAFVREQAVEALNFQITVTLGMIVSMVLFIVIIGYFTMMAIGIGALALCILGGVAANRGEHYRYPVALRLVS